MRKWEVDENKAVPSNLVREQDFIMRVRRFHRLAVPYVFVNILLTHVDAGHGGGPLEEAQERFQSFANATAGAYAEMSNGDVFLYWPRNAVPQNLLDQIISIVLPPGTSVDDVKDYMLTFHLPDGYVTLRERLQHYVDTSRAPVITGTEKTASQLLMSEAARGPLTTWGADQIGKLIQDIDIHRYLKRQTVYERRIDGKWLPLFDEWFIGIDDLRRAHFPKMSFDASDHLFSKLCQALDQRLLSDLISYSDSIASQTLSLNLTIPSLLGSTFASFSKIIPHQRHGSVICEMNCSDLFQSFSATLNARELLLKEGFRVCIDGITPDMLLFLNLVYFKSDYIKINVSKERFAPLEKPQTRLALMAIPREKVILFRCDHERALTLGMNLGITKFQGWYIDDLVSGK